MTFAQHVEKTRLAAKLREQLQNERARMLTGLSEVSSVLLDAIGLGRIAQVKGETVVLLPPSFEYGSEIITDVPLSALRDLQQAGLLYRLTEHGERCRLGWKEMQENSRIWRADNGFGAIDFDGENSELWVCMQ